MDYRAIVRRVYGELLERATMIIAKVQHPPLIAVYRRKGADVVPDTMLRVAKLSRNEGQLTTILRRESKKGLAVFITEAWVAPTRAARILGRGQPRRSEVLVMHFLAADATAARAVSAIVLKDGVRGLVPGELIFKSDEAPPERGALQ